MTLQREALLENLKAAKQIAKASHDQVDRQKMTIEALAAIGADTADAKRILQILEECQNTHLAEMMRALNALDDMPSERSDLA